MPSLNMVANKAVEANLIWIFINCFFQEHNIFGHWGAGGQMIFADPSHQLGWSYVTNYCNILHGFIIDHRYAALQKAMYECVYEISKQKWSQSYLSPQACMHTLSGAVNQLNVDVVDAFVMMFSSTCHNRTPRVREFWGDNLKCY